MIQPSTLFTQTTWSQIYRFGLVFNRIIFAFIFVILIPWLQFCPPLTVYNLMYICQILFLPTLVAAFPLSMSKLLLLRLRNMDFRDGNFLNSLLQQVSKDSHHVLTNLDIFSHSWPMNSKYSSRIPLRCVLFLKKEYMSTSWSSMSKSIISW